MKLTTAGAAATALLLLSLTQQTAKADATFVLDNANITGAAGTTTGWGFTATSDTYHMTIANIVLLPGASIGTFYDLLAIRGTFEVGPNPSPFSSTHESFNNSLGTGAGAFEINPGTPVGTIYLATMYVVYNLYAVSPNHGAFNPFDPSHTISEGNLFEIPVSVQVVNAPPPPPPAVPEPSTYSAILLAAGAGWLLRKRRKV